MCLHSKAKMDYVMVVQFHAYKTWTDFSLEGKQTPQASQGLLSETDSLTFNKELDKARQLEWSLQNAFQPPLIYLSCYASSTENQS